MKNESRIKNDTYAIPIPSYSLYGRGKQSIALASHQVCREDCSSDTRCHHFSPASRVWILQRCPTLGWSVPASSIALKIPIEY